MDTALTAPATAAPVMVTPTEAPNFVQRLNGLPLRSKLMMGLGLAALAAAVLAVTLWSSQGDYRPLFTGLADKDGGAVIGQLAAMNVPYKHEAGGTILVPAGQVYELRMKLAAQGLPKSGGSGSGVGFELMDKSSIGQTQFNERLNFQRGLEGELTRSIQALSSVQSARVHLALPNQNGFFREQQKPSASVLVSLHPGRILDRAQLAGIVHLVASSVPELSPSAVSVLDDTGKLLSQSPDSAAGAAIDAQQLAYVQQIEQQYTRRILDILEPVVGRNNVKAQVTAEVDFTQTEQTSEQHRPNQGSEAAAVRSQQVVESNGSTDNTTTPTGVPGAVANQPPGQANAPINGANPAPNAAGGQQQASAATQSKRESITNYEVDRTVRVTRGGTGAIKRVNAAVVVNYQMAEEKGKPVPKALTPEQIEQMTALVRETIGFNKDRGDSVNLMNTPFQMQAPTDTSVPLWRQPEVLDIARSLAWPLGAVMFGALVLFGLVRPALKGMAAPAAGGAATRAPGQPALAGTQLNALEADTPERPALPAPVKQDEAAVVTPEQLRLEEARKLAKDNPIAVANLVKQW
ncbi:MAG: flagellar M-ring protein FliF, partial [Proteobacteria bacterium]|nr:flagellar M-ring protein FliF [Pseudomonadota bacterium]